MHAVFPAPAADRRFWWVWATAVMDSHSPPQCVGGCGRLRACFNFCGPTTNTPSPLHSFTSLPPPTLPHHGARGPIQPPPKEGAKPANLRPPLGRHKRKHRSDPLHLRKRARQHPGHVAARHAPHPHRAVSRAGARVVRRGPRPLYAKVGVYARTTRGVRQLVYGAALGRGNRRSGADTDGVAEGDLGG